MMRQLALADRLRTAAASAGERVWDALLMGGLLGANQVDCARGLADRLPVAREAWLRTRPSLPLLFWMAAGMWAGTTASLGLLREAPLSWELWLAGAGALLAGVAVMWLLCRTGCAAAAVLCAGICLGVLCGSGGAVHLQAAQQVLQAGSGSWVVQLVSDGRSGAYGETLTGTVGLPAGGSALVQVNLADSPHLLAGEAVEVQAEWEAPRAAVEEQLWGKGVAATARVAGYTVRETAGPQAVLRGVRVRALEALEQAGNGDGICFLEAVLLGYRARLFQADWYDAAKVDGLAHLMAVSGAHLSLVCGMALALMGRFHWGRRTQLAVQCALMAAYLVLTGVPASAVRAAFMTLIGLSAFLAQRRAYSLGALSFAVVAMLVMDPFCANSTSFVLSAGSTLGIVLFARPVGEWMRRLAGCAHQGAVLQAVALTLSSQLVVGPVTACVFGQVSLIAPLANVLAVPVFAGVCGVGLPMVLLAAALPGLVVVLGVLGSACGVFCTALQVLASAPAAAIPAWLTVPAALLLGVAVPAAVWLLWPRPSWKALCAAAVAAVLGSVLVVVLPAQAGDQVIMLDVGQGDALVLRSGGKTLLIDTGNHDARLLQGLARQGIRHLDAVAISHADDDHCGSLGALRGSVAVDRVLLAQDMLSCSDSKARALVSQAKRVAGAVEGLSAGQRLSFGNFRVRVVGPASFAQKGGNQDSLVLLLEADDNADGVVDWRGLFCGDAEAETLRSYVAQGRLGWVDLLKVGHHGSRAAMDAGLAKALHPRICLVSVGAHNRYGHPVADTLQALEREGARICRTDTQGEVACVLASGALRVSTQR